jgi:hypothetical protein
LFDVLVTVLTLLVAITDNVVRLIINNLFASRITGNKNLHVGFTCWGCILLIPNFGSIANNTGNNCMCERSHFVRPSTVLCETLKKFHMILIK